MLGNKLVTRQPSKRLCLEDLRHSCSCTVGQLQFLETPLTLLARNDESRLLSHLEGITGGAEAMGVWMLAGLPLKATATLEIYSEPCTGKDGPTSGRGQQCEGQTPGPMEYLQISQARRERNFKGCWCC